MRTIIGIKISAHPPAEKHCSDDIHNWNQDLSSTYSCRNTVLRRIENGARQLDQHVKWTGKVHSVHVFAVLQTFAVRCAASEAAHVFAPRFESRGARRSVFYLSLSGRPGAPEAEGGREKTKTRKQGGGPGARPQNADRPSARGV